jgi:large subunit ribosomal protein L4
MKAPVYNQEGEKTGEALLPKEVFGQDINPDLIYQVAVSQRANRRQVLAHTKDRSEVRGGGRKPWRQKGTGRARHGSRRSPLWKGGGVTFGPTNRRNFKKRIPKRMKKKALLMVLSAKAKENLILILEKLEVKGAKTRFMKEILKKLPLNGSCLIVLPKADKKIVRASSNIPGLGAEEIRNLNALDLLSFKCLILPKEGIKILKETFVK